MKQMMSDIADLGCSQPAKNSVEKAAILNAIHQTLLTSPPIGHAGLLSGDAGVVLYFWYWLKQHQPSDPLYQATERQFQHRLNSVLQQVALMPGNEFGDGPAGICWLMELLLQEQTAPYQPTFNQAFEQLQRQNLQPLQQYSGELELVRGLTGQLVTASRRLLALPDSTATIDWIRQLLRLLQQSATQQEALYYWPTPINSRFFQQDAGVGQVNLGLAHGMPGILAALIPLLQYAELRDLCEPLLHGGCDWLIQQQLLANSLSVFPTCYPQTLPSRLGWCYGDLTIALTLSRAANALQVDHWREIALATALKASQRQAHDGPISDCGICHGSSGLVLIFRLLAEQLANQQLHATAERWLDWTVAKFSQQGITSLYPFHSEQSRHGFLEGLAGIGLVLLSDPNQPASWADALLLADPFIQACSPATSTQEPTA